MSAICRISGIPSGPLLVNPDLAIELANVGIIAATNTVGEYTLINGRDDALWAYIRQRSR